MSNPQHPDDNPTIPRQRTGEPRVRQRDGTIGVESVAAYDISTDDLPALVAALVADALAALDTSDRVASPIPAPRGGNGRRARTTPSSTGRLTLDEVCADLRISRSTFSDWRTKGKAPRCIKLPNGELRIDRAEFERWLSEREDAA